MLVCPYSLHDYQYYFCSFFVAIVSDIVAIVSDIVAIVSDIVATAVTTAKPYLVSIISITPYQ